MFVIYKQYLKQLLLVVEAVLQSVEIFRRKKKNSLASFPRVSAIPLSFCSVRGLHQLFSD